MSVVTIDKDNFQTEVLNEEKTVLLDFWASWCGPCKMMAPVVEEIAKERPDIKVGKIDVDEQPELAGQYRVMSIPTLVVMKGGKEQGQRLRFWPCWMNRHDKSMRVRQNVKE